MPEKPKIMQAVSEMIAQGLSDDEIVENLRAVGLSDDQIKKVMEVSQRDVYARFKREMGQFFEQRLRSSSGVIDKMVDDSLARKKEEIRSELSSEVQEIVGDLAREVNTKARDMELSVKKIREENLELRKMEQLNRSDIDLLLAGPFKYRLAISVVFLVAGVLVLVWDIFDRVPEIGKQLAASNPQAAAMNSVIVAAFVAAAIASFAVGVYFSGRPGRQ